MILVFHHLTRDVQPPSDENILPVKDFARQMRELRKYRVVNFNQYDATDPTQAIITFDDGGKSVLYALPILQSLRYPFHVFIVGDWIGKPGYMDEEDLRKCIRAGGRLQWHTYSHVDLTKMDEQALSIELRVPPEIRKLDGKGFSVLAYPFGAYSRRVQEVAREQGFLFARTCNLTKSSANICPNLELEAKKMKANSSLSDEIVKYIELVVPTWPCNFRCHYCYVGQKCSDEQRSHIDEFKYSPEQVAEKLSVSSLGGRAIINICANGETLILPRNIEYIKSMLAAGHFVMVVSNMTPTKQINQLLSLPSEFRSRLFFKCSFHYLELKRLNLLGVFTDNVNNAWKAGASITVEITPSDELEPYIDEIKSYSLQHFGALPHITVPRDENNGYEALTKHSKSEYSKIWGDAFHSALFDFKMSIWGVKNKQFCYAGAWGYSINLACGDVFRCSTCGMIGNMFDAPPLSDPLPIDPVGRDCPFPHCYNGHFWEIFGMIPDKNCPTFAEMRNRVRADNTQWVYPRMLSAFSSKAYYTNSRLSLFQEMFYRKKKKKRHHSLWWHIKNRKF